MADLTTKRDLSLVQLDRFVKLAENRHRESEVAGRNRLPFSYYCSGQST